MIPERMPRSEGIETPGHRIVGVLEQSRNECPDQRGLRLETHPMDGAYPRTPERMPRSEGIETCLNRSLPHPLIFPERMPRSEGIETNLDRRGDRALDSTRNECPDQRGLRPSLFP